MNYVSIQLQRTISLLMVLFFKFTAESFWELLCKNRRSKTETGSCTFSMYRLRFLSIN
ncbi:hypothetical protein Mapa_011956 [Marchantia paleacea]|nr:hypothetical protein Mapa_011956 [Marchantia paleacea]